MQASSDKLADIAAGISRPARIELIDLLTELFSILANLEVLCTSPPPGCNKYMTFKKLKGLLKALVEAENADRE